MREKLEWWEREFEADQLPADTVSEERVWDEGSGI